MKKVLFFTLLILSSMTFLSLNDDNNIAITYKLLNTDTKYGVEFCEKAISEANWCGFRYKNKRNLIQFDTGLKVELYS